MMLLIAPFSLEGHYYTYAQLHQKQDTFLLGGSTDLAHASE